MFAALRDHVTDGDRRAWKRAAMVASIVATTATGKPFSADDFDPFAVPPEPPKPKTWQDMLAAVEAINAAAGGKDLRVKRA